MGKTRKKTGKGKAEKKTASLAVAKRILDILKSARSVQLEIDKLNIERLLIETYSDQNTEKAEDFQGELATNKRTVKAKADILQKKQKELAKQIRRAESNKTLCSPLSDGDTLLVKAIAFQNLHAVKLLVSSGANPNQILTEGRYHACSVFHAGLRKIFNKNQHSITVQIPNEVRGYLASTLGATEAIKLHYDQNSLERVEKMLITFNEAKFNLNLNRIEQLKSKQETLAERQQKRKNRYLQVNLAPDKRHIADKVADKEVSTSLIYALTYRFVYPHQALMLTELLVNNGANVNLAIKDDYGNAVTTPLHQAIRFQPYPTTKFLIEHGAQPNQRAGFDFNIQSREFEKVDKAPRMLALELGKFNIARTLAVQTEPLSMDDYFNLFCPLFTEIHKHHELIAELFKELNMEFPSNLHSKDRGAGVSSLLEIAIKYEGCMATIEKSSDFDLSNDLSESDFKLSKQLISAGWDINFMCSKRGSILRCLMKLRIKIAKTDAHLNYNLSVKFCLEQGANLNIVHEGISDLECLLKSKDSELISMVCSQNTVNIPDLRIHDKDFGQINPLHYLALHYTLEEAKPLIDLLSACVDGLTKTGESAADLATLARNYQLACILHLQYKCSLKPENKLALIAGLIAKDKLLVLKLLNTNPTWIPLGNYEFTPRTLARLSNRSNCMSMLTLSNMPEGIRFKGRLYVPAEDETLCVYVSQGRFTVKLKHKDNPEDQTVYEAPPIVTQATSRYAFCQERGFPTLPLPADTATPAIAEPVALVSWLSSPEADGENMISPIRNSDLPCFLFIDRNAVGDCPLMADFEAVEAKFDRTHIKALADSGLTVLVDGQPHPITHEIKLPGQKARLLCYSINEDGKTLLVAAIYAPKGLHSTADKASVSASLAAKELTQPQFAEASPGPGCG